MNTGFEKPGPQCEWCCSISNFVSMVFPHSLTTKEQELNMLSLLSFDYITYFFRLPYFTKIYKN